MNVEVTHNANDQLLMGYAAGILPEAFDLVMASHIAISDEARARFQSFEAVGGAVLDKAPVAEMAPSALDAVLARLDAPTEKPVDPAPRLEGVFPKALQDYVGGDADAVKWRPIGMGVKQCVLPTQGDATARLLYIPAGAAVPDHGHQGTELTLVLQGAFSDEVDRFARGDLEIATEDLEHTPVADMGEDCICLAATDAPLKFKSLLPRIMQPFLKI
ncbi:MAG: ChrR family anti-sigma-E factor [Pseudomonadota bacterium]